MDVFCGAAQAAAHGAGGRGCLRCQHRWRGVVREKDGEEHWIGTDSLTILGIPALGESVDFDPHLARRRKEYGREHRSEGSGHTFWNGAAVFNDD